MSTLLTTVEDRVLTVVLNRPERRNALTTELLQDLADAVTHADPAANVDVVVITGADPAFCAGVDLGELEATGQAPDFATPLPPISKPVVGAINGAASTGGLELALACDLLVASEQARFADTHARLGLLPGWGQTARLPHAVGTRRALELPADEPVRRRRGGAANRPREPRRAPRGGGEPGGRARARDRQGRQPVVRAVLALLRENVGAPLATSLERGRAAADAWQSACIDASALARGRGRLEHLSRRGG